MKNQNQMRFETKALSCRDEVVKNQLLKFGEKQPKGSPPQSNRLNESPSKMGNNSLNIRYSEHSTPKNMFQINRERKKGQSTDILILILVILLFVLILYALFRSSATC